MPNHPAMANHPPARHLTPTRDRLAVIDAVRTLSITIVILGHSVNLAPVTTGPLAWWLGQLGANSTYGVTIFFVVSGFIITHTVAERYRDLHLVSVKDFYLRRIARLLPLACIVLLTGVAVGWLSQPDYGRNFVLHQTGAQFSWWMWLSFPALVFNWVRIAAAGTAAGWGLQWDIFWSLAIEEQFYLFYPFLLRWTAGRRRRLAGALVIVAAFGLGYRALMTHWFPGQFMLGFMASPTGFESIAIGALAWLIADTGWHRRWPAPGRWAVAALAGYGAYRVIFGPMIGLDLTARVFGPTLLSLCVGAILLVTTESSHTRFIPRLAGYPGSLSYGLYLLHPLVILGLWELWGGGHPLRLAVAVLLTGLAAATLSARFIEMPLNRQLRRHLPILWRRWRFHH